MAGDTAITTATPPRTTPSPIFTPSIRTATIATVLIPITMATVPTGTDTATAGSRAEAAMKKTLSAVGLALCLSLLAGCVVYDGPGAYAPAPAYSYGYAYPSYSYAYPYAYSHSYAYRPHYSYRYYPYRYRYRY